MDGMKDVLYTILQKMEAVENFSKLNGEEKKNASNRQFKMFHDRRGY